MDYLLEKSHFRWSKEGLYPNFEQVSFPLQMLSLFRQLMFIQINGIWNLKPHMEDDW